MAIDFKVLAARTLQSLEEANNSEERLAFLEEAYRRICEYGHTCEGTLEQGVEVVEKEDNVIQFKPTGH